MRNRNKYDWSKPFKFVDNKKIFDELDTNEESLIIVIQTEEVKEPANYKQQIPVPKIDIVSRTTEIKQFAKITPNYIRLPAHLNLPLANNYELTQVDHTFVKTYEEKYIYKGKRILTKDFLRKVFIELEVKAGKDMILPRSKGWLMSYFERQYKQFLQMDNLEQFAQLVYNFWKNRREELKFPLLRILWKPNPQQYNHLLAFRPRQRDKRSLRRTNRGVEDQIIEQLYQQFDLALKIADRINARQQLKFRQIQLQMNTFYSQCKQLVSIPVSIEEFKTQDRQKDKQKMKAFHSNLENYKNRKQSLQNFKIEDANIQQIDQKQSIVNFLSAIVYQAEILGISHQKIYYPGNSFVEKPKGINSILPVINSEQIDEIVPEQIKSPQQYLSLSLSKYQDKMLRSFSSELDEHHIKPCHDFLEYKRRHVDGYYFGSDDEGQAKDLRKNISGSFKKFQQLHQMQQMTRTISLTSQN